MDELKYNTITLAIKLESCKIFDECVKGLVQLYLSVTNSGCHALDDIDVAADLPKQLTLCADWRSRSGCASSMTHHRITMLSAAGPPTIDSAVLDNLYVPGAAARRVVSRSLRKMLFIGNQCYLALTFWPTVHWSLTNGRKLQVCVVRLSRPTTIYYVSVHSVYALYISPILNNWQDIACSIKRSTASKVYVQLLTWYTVSYIMSTECKHILFSLSELLLHCVFVANCNWWTISGGKSSGCCDA